MFVFFMEIFLFVLDRIVELINYIYEIEIYLWGEENFLNVIYYVKNENIINFDIYWWEGIVIKLLLKI